MTLMGKRLNYAKKKKISFDIYMKLGQVLGWAAQELGPSPIQIQFVPTCLAKATTE